jgi:hypothetical protein
MLTRLAEYGRLLVALAPIAVLRFRIHRPPIRPVAAGDYSLIPGKSEYRGILLGWKRQWNLDVRLPSAPMEFSRPVASRR